MSNHFEVTITGLDAEQLKRSVNDRMGCWSTVVWDRATLNSHLPQLLNSIGSDFCPQVEDPENPFTGWIIQTIEIDSFEFEDEDDDDDDDDDDDEFLNEERENENVDN
jgi:hypothetical protein